MNDSFFWSYVINKKYLVSLFKHTTFFAMVGLIALWLWWDIYKTGTKTKKNYKEDEIMIL